MTEGLGSQQPYHYATAKGTLHLPSSAPSSSGGLPGDRAWPQCSIPTTGSLSSPPMISPLQPCGLKQGMEDLALGNTAAGTVVEQAWELDTTLLGWVGEENGPASHRDKPAPRPGA